MTVSGLVGGVVYGSIVRRFKGQVKQNMEEFLNSQTTQVSGVKVSFALSSVSCIGLLLCLRLPDVFPLILLFAFLFGFFGLSSYPLFLELAVENAFPLDPVISEVSTIVIIIIIIIIIITITFYQL